MQQFVSFLKKLTMQQHTVEHLYSGVFIPEKRKRVYRKSCIHIFTVVLFAIAPNWKPPRYLNNRWMVKQWYVHTMEYYWAMERNELSLYPSWIQKGIMLNEKKSISKDHLWYISIYIYYISLNDRIMDIEPD